MKYKTTLIAFNVAALCIHVFNGSVGHVLAKEGNPKVPCIAPLFEFSLNSTTDSMLFTPMPKLMFRVGALLGFELVSWVTAGFHVIYLVQLLSPGVRSWVKKNISERSANPIRWIEYSISAGMLVAFEALYLGMSDFNIFVSYIAANAAVQMVGFILEILDSDVPVQNRVGGLLWTQASILNTANVALLLYQVFASKTYTNIFYYNVVPFALLFNTFGVVAWLNFKKRGFFRSPEYTELWYIALSVTTKFAIFWLGYSTYRGLQEERLFASRTRGINWDTVRITASVLPISVVAVAAVEEYVRFRTVARPVAKMKVAPLVLEARIEQLVDFDVYSSAVETKWL